MLIGHHLQGTPGTDRLLGPPFPCLFDFVGRPCLLRSYPVGELHHTFFRIAQGAASTLSPTSSTSPLFSLSSPLLSPPGQPIANRLVNTPRRLSLAFFRSLTCLSQPSSIPFRLDCCLPFPVRTARLNPCACMHTYAYCIRIRYAAGPRATGKRQSRKSKEKKEKGKKRERKRRKD